MSNNFRVIVASTGRQHFDAAFSLACGDRKATHFAIQDGVGSHPSSITLFWSEPEQLRSIVIQRLPFEMKGEALRDFSWAWLAQAKYQTAPDIDGENKKGFVMTTGEPWTGNLDGSHYGLVKISTGWQMYGK